jgi:ABC-2 type transport system ATP-binding protein
MSTEAAIEARGLTKLYGSHKAVDHIDLTVNRGEIYGLLGPNGAGKTTTILMLLGLTEPTEGTVSVLGHNPLNHPLEVKRRVGYLPDSVGFYDDLTGRANLRYGGKLAGIPSADLEGRVEEALARVRLDKVGDKPAGSYSHGMKQRLGLAEVFMKRPQLAILDEPTSGLDPYSTHELLDLIRELKHEGVTVLLSSHLLNQVQSICDEVILFRDGKIALQGTLAQLSKQVIGGGYVVQVESAGGDVEAALAGMPGVVQVKPDGKDAYRISCESDIRAAVAQRLISKGIGLLRLNVIEPSLDEIYARYFESQRPAA